MLVTSSVFIIITFLFLLAQHFYVYSLDPVNPKGFSLWSFFFFFCYSACNWKQIRSHQEHCELACLQQCGEDFTAKMSELPSWTIRGWDQTFDTKSRKFHIKLQAANVQSWITAQLGLGDVVEISITMLIKLLTDLHFVRMWKVYATLYIISKLMLKAIKCTNVNYMWPNA